MKRGTLAWRLYALGVVQLALVTLAVVVLAIRDAPGPPPQDLERQVDIAAVRLTPLLAHPNDLSSELGELRSHGIGGSIYDGQEKLLASNVTPPLGPRPHWHHRPPPPPPDEEGPQGPPPTGAGGLPPGPPPMGPPYPGGPNDGPPGFPHGPHLDHVMVVPMGAPTATGQPTLVARFMPPPRDWRGPIFTFALGLLIVGVGALLMGRWIVRPLEQLSRAARALGEGDLRARSGSVRRDEVGEVSRTFDEMAERVEQLVRAEKELLANVSHELRTPLARIRVALDLAVEGDAVAARESLSEIEVDLAELETLLSDVLTAARMDIGASKATPAGFALHVEEVLPQALVDHAVERFRARHPGRSVETMTDEGLPLLSVDRTLFRRVLHNLLENADKYSPDTDRPIVLHTHMAGSRVAFEVKDSGMGIPGEDVPHVFEPFFRGERSRSRGAGGVGLGLTLAKRITAAHGGTIAVTSVVGTGTTVKVELPPA